MPTEPEGTQTEQPLVDRFDHVVIAVKDLDAAIVVYRALGFDVVAGGRHEQFGTRNAIVRFGLDYIELLSVYDEELAVAAGPARRALVEFLRHSEGPVGFALATRDSDRLADRFHRIGLDAFGPSPMNRRRPDGTVLSWRLLTPHAVAWRRPWPFFIHWDLPDHERVRLGLARAGTHPNGVAAISGVTVAVRELGAAVELYQRQIGLPVTTAPDRPDLGAHRAITGISGFVIELLAPSGPGVLLETIATVGEGVFELVLRSDDLSMSRDCFAKAHVTARPGPDATGLSVGPDAALGARLVIVP